MVRHPAIPLLIRLSFLPSSPHDPMIPPAPNRAQCRQTDSGMLIQGGACRWECVLIFRRFAIGFISVIIAEPMLQAASTLIVLAIMLSAQAYAAPFVRADIDVPPLSQSDLKTLSV